MRRKHVVASIQIDYTRLLYEQTGHGPPLLLIHGLSGSARWWRRNIPALAQYFTVYAVELVGFGANRGPQPLPLRRSADTLAMFIERLAQGPAYVIGHSMGGHIATYLAAEHPQLVKRLVLAAASGLVQEPLINMAVRLPRVARHTGRGFGTTLVWDAARAGALNLFFAARELLADDVSAMLQRITVPTLIVSGERDVLIPPGSGAEQHAAIRGSEYAVLPGAGHILMWDEAERFNRLVLQFLLADEQGQGYQANGREV